jgi:hypothetical protein
MTIKSDHLAEVRQSFVRRFASEEFDSRRWRYDFEVELDRLIYAAFAAAQEPYVSELELYRENKLKTVLLAVKP